MGNLMGTAPYGLLKFKLNGILITPGNQKNGCSSNIENQYWKNDRFKTYRKFGAADWRNS